MTLEASTTDGNSSILISASTFDLLREAFQDFADETDIVIGVGPEMEIEGVEIEGACLLELFLALQPVVQRLREASTQYLSEIETIEALMEKANGAYNAESVLRIRQASK